MNSEVRVRFAPSPTGYLHVGGARTALFNWLYARHCGGKFILRVEDTDKARNTEAAVQVILDGLTWLGLDWDEGPVKGGSLGPYFQSQREHVYQHYFDLLRDAGHLYEDQGAWRFRSLRRKVTVRDIICGDIEFDLSNPETHPDMTIRRHDGSWIFHFVNVVDDIEMQISHVIRGEDHLSNTPKHLELFIALEKQPPHYAHIPLILNKNGSKMSKRDEGASITSYIEKGFLPAAVRNYLALLGWSPKDGREELSIAETVQLFDLDKVHRKNAQFDIDKCVWLNGQHILHMPADEFVQNAIAFLQEHDFTHSKDASIPKVLRLVQEKVKVFSELPAAIGFFFEDNFPIDEAASSKAFASVEMPSHLAALAEAFSTDFEWLSESIENALKDVAATRGIKPNSLLLPVRIAVSGRAGGPSLYPLLEIVGRERTLIRLRKSVERI
jgi:glutamyl-tRNA synthetase